MSIVKPYTFADATKANANEVNANFDTIYTAVSTLQADKATSDFINGIHTMANGKLVYVSGFYAAGDAGEGNQYVYNVSAITGTETWNDTGYGFFISNDMEIKINALQKIIPAISKNIVVGSVGVKNINDDVIIQRVVNKALPNRYNIHVDKDITIVGTINVDRDSGDRRIIKFYGSGVITKNTAGFLFGVTITDRNAGNLRFSKIKFSSTNGIGMVIYDSSKLIRMYFDGCDFLNVDSLASIPNGSISPNNYIQTLYVTDSAIVGGTGYFIKSPFMYDVSFEHSIMENRDAAFYCITFNSVRIFDNLIESLTGLVFYGTNGIKLNISNNYFEECMTSGVENYYIHLFGTDPSGASITIQDNFIVGTSGQKTNDSFYFVGTDVVPKSMKIGGNSSDINMYKITRPYSITPEFLAVAMTERVVAGRVQVNGYPVVGDIVRGTGNLLREMKKPFASDFVTQYLSKIADVPANVTLALAATGKYLYCKAAAATAQVGFKINKTFTLSPFINYVISIAGDAYLGVQPSTIIRVRDSSNVVVFTYTLDWQNYYGTRGLGNFYSLPPFTIATEGLFTLEFEFDQSGGTIPINSAMEFSYIGIQQGTIGQLHDSIKYDSAWNGDMLKLGTYNLWVDSSGRLRTKNGYPISDTDGTIVGTQT